MENLILVGLPIALMIAAYLAFAGIVYRDSKLSPKSIRLSFSLLSPAFLGLLVFASFYIFSQYMPGFLEEIFSTINGLLDRGRHFGALVSCLIIVFTVGVIPIGGMLLIRHVFKTIGEKIEGKRDLQSN